eukprot:scaffold3291_cov109-Isochrysis_galbana.AAC.10
MTGAAAPRRAAPPRGPLWQRGASCLNKSKYSYPRTCAPPRPRTASMPAYGCHGWPTLRRHTGKSYNFFLAALTLLLQLLLCRQQHKGQGRALSGVWRLGRQGDASLAPAAGARQSCRTPPKRCVGGPLRGSFLTRTFAWQRFGV